MRVLVTAGGTAVPIDRVRRITNWGTGETGKLIAMEALKRGFQVTLLTSNPFQVPLENPALSVAHYQFFDEYLKCVENLVTSGDFQAVILSAAVSDYSCSGFFPSQGSKGLEMANTGKIGSEEKELWVRLDPLPKVIDKIRNPWGYQKKLVKFKLECKMAEEELLLKADQSRIKSKADLVVANTVEEAREWAWVGPLNGKFQKVPRKFLPGGILDALATLKG